MEAYIPISFLNDFIFCPRSIYFHQLYGNYKAEVFQQRPQVAGKAAHSSIDEQIYSTRKNILQGTDVYSDRYKLCGKIDLFDTETGRLSERKREVKVIYDGYIFQVYAQYHALVEMGYIVNSIVIYDISHNKNYPIPLPPDDPEKQNKFEEVIRKLNEFNMDDSTFSPIETKCRSCIYSNLCDYSLC